MLPARIAVRSTELPPKTEADVRERVAGLLRYYDRIVSCIVTIDVPQRRRKCDALQYRVRLEIAVPGGEIVINRQPREQLRTAVQEAFGSARRRLQDYARRQSGAVKAHEPQPIGGCGNVGVDAARAEYVDPAEAGIIDPTKVVRVALENAASGEEV